MSLATRLVSCFPTTAEKLVDPQVYLLEVADAIDRYPRMVGAAAVARLIRTAQFLPNVSEVVTACEGLTASTSAAATYDARVRKQLAEREEAEKPVDPGERERVIAGFKELQQLLRSAARPRNGEKGSP